MARSHNRSHSVIYERMKEVHSDAVHRTGDVEHEGASMGNEQVFQQVLLQFSALFNLVVTISSSIFASAEDKVATEFAVGQEVTVLGTSLFLVGYIVGPLLFGPLSEKFGRKWPLIVGVCLSSVFGLMTTLGQNLATIFIGRFFAGLFGVAPIAVLGGIITDCWNALYRGVALAFCICLVFAGPTFGPIVGGFIVENTSWRWTMWVVVIAGLALGFVAVFTYPESYPPKVLQIRAKSIRRKMDNPTIVSPLDLEGLSLEKVFQLYLVRPWVLFFTEPILVSLTFYQAFIYGLMYVCYQSYPIAFMEVRGWSQGFASLALIGIIVGVVMGTATVVIYNQLYFKRKVQANDGKFEPEARLPLMIFGGCLVPTGLFWYAWTSDPSIPWPSEVCAGILVGWGMYTIFIQCFSYIIDCYTDMANSAMAANGAVRSVFGAVFPLFANYMYHNLGVDWASSLVGFLALVMVPVPIIFYYYGARIRARSKKARFRS
ncbi:uncharacterized protein An10g00050 [Aspergillus niger]|uniref:Contig An10c0020, genomic contig n=2 Tax=Aspergillus niger TaxID=5061 RepID=A2QUV7_ASPNC|nr:uncharacterized protein An10g00050 [Aspergillus niger]CAK49096.1 unnamed protein product [Aspergillus niger]